MRQRDASARLRVHVLIDQEISDASKSGLVRCWMQCLPELARHDELDVTLHGVGQVSRTHALARNARIVEHRTGVVSTALLRAIGLEAPVRTGLLPFHRGVARAIADADVLHTTYTMLPFALTAAWVAARRGIPLTSSLHTHVPLHAEVYAQDFARIVFGRTPLAPALVARGGFARTIRRAIERETSWYLRRCAHVFVSEPPDVEPLPAGIAPERVSLLGRGVDTDVLSIEQRDPGWLRLRFGIPAGRAIVLFVGRIAPEKNVLVIARAVAELAARGRDVALLLCGEGPQREAVARLLGERAIFAGVLPHGDLARVYASSDVFGFPSTTEMFANVVMEAMSCGLPPVVNAAGGSRQHLETPGEDGIVLTTDEPAAWADALDTLLCHPARRARMSEAARTTALRRSRSWGDVVDSTIVPVWAGVAQRRLAGASAPAASVAAAASPVRERSRAVAPPRGDAPTPPVTPMLSRFRIAAARREHEPALAASGVAEDEARDGLREAFGVVDHHRMPGARDDGERRAR